jgi:hypothetical protein
MLMAKPTKRKRRRGQTAQRTYQAVERVVAAKKLSKSDAFKVVGKRTGRTPGSIAVTYYRVARAQRGGVAARRGGVAGGIDTVMSRATAVLKDLRQLVRRQQRQIARLQAESAWATKIRQALRGR